jgi:ArsR family transcriptional regulator
MDAHPNHKSVAPLQPDILGALQAVAEPTRARIVALLGHGEHCVCDVGEMLAQHSPGLASPARRSAERLREQGSRWVYYSSTSRVAALRAAVADLLTPTPAATTACLCSDCGSQRTAIPEPGPLRRLPLVAELSS